MIQKRQDDIPEPCLIIWKKEKGGWTVRKEDLLTAIAASPNSEETIRNRMGRGFSNIEKALNGEVLTIWNLKHIEWGLDLDI